MANQEQAAGKVRRYCLAIAVGSFAAVSLLWVMQYLVATGQAAVTEARETGFIEFVRVEKPPVVNTKDRKPKRPPKPEDEPPHLPSVIRDNVGDGPAVPGAPEGPTVNTDLDRILGNFRFDGDYLPLVRVRPEYPRTASSRGLEGHCDLEFTVTPLGTTADVRVIRCTNSVFERNSIRAVLKYKYKPRVVNGTALAVPGLRLRITFDIED
jgi:protein TonB